MCLIITYRNMIMRKMVLVTLSVWEVTNALPECKKLHLSFFSETVEVRSFKFLDKFFSRQLL